MLTGYLSSTSQIAHARGQVSDSLTVNNDTVTTTVFLSALRASMKQLQIQYNAIGLTFFTIPGYTLDIFLEI